MSTARFCHQELLRSLEDDIGAPLSSRARATLREAFDAYQGKFRQAKTPAHRQPFIAHPVGTARLVIAHFPFIENVQDDLDTIICVALAHDLIEDTRVDGARIEAVAGPKVREYVEALTKRPAEVTGKSKELRNRDALDRVLSAGPTAVLVKICDSMHNLSWPVATPLPLLQKLIDKAKDQYLVLLDRYPLGESFRRAYCRSISEAEECLADELKYVRPCALPGTLDAAVTECLASSSGKILELHDISTILGDICRAKSVTMWRFASKGEDWLTHVTGLATSNAHVRVRATVPFDAPQVLKGQKLQGLRRILPQDACSTAYTVPMQTDVETMLVVVLGFSGEGPPGWLSIEAATMLVQFLAHRLIVSEADRRSALADAANRLGIQCTVDLAARIPVSPAELTELHRWRNHCQEAVEIVTRLVNSFFSSGPSILPLHDLVRVESRTKSIDSILRKYASPTKRVWPQFQKLEDIAGVRVVCPTLSGIDAIEHFLLSDRSLAAGVRLHPAIDEPRRDYMARPVSGYKAVHLILEVDVRSQHEPSTKVPCEVQLRTILQDTWAFVSHGTLYQASRTERHRLGDALRRLAAQLEGCEPIMEELAHCEEDASGSGSRIGTEVVEDRVPVLVGDRSYQIAVRHRPGPNDLIVFLHGLGCSQETYKHVWGHPAFRQYSLLSFDFLGFGDSEKPEDFRYRMEDHAKVCEQLIGRYRKTRVHLVAHSMGAAVALTLPEEVLYSAASLVNVEGNLISEDCGLVSRIAIRMSLEAFEDTGFSQLRLDLRQGTDDYFDFDKTLPRAFYRSAESLVRESDNGRLLDRFTRFPLSKRLYVYGQRNRGAEVLSRLTDGEKVEVVESGHFPMRDNPREFYGILLGFLQQVQDE